MADPEEQRYPGAGALPGADQIARGTALITGASAGIGEALAHVFAREGHDLVLVARREDRLERLARKLQRRHEVGVSVIAMDLTSADAAQRLVGQLDALGKEVDTLVNNAGRALLGRFHEIEPTRLVQMLALNATTPTALTRLLLDGMVERGSGRILNVASIAAFQPVPSLALYAASKAFVLSFSEALAEDLRGTGVTVTALCPGFTDTEMLQRAEEHQGRSELFHGLAVMSAEAVAEAGYRACMRGEAVAVPGLGNRAFTGLVQLSPRVLVRRMGGLLARMLS